MSWSILRRYRYLLLLGLASEAIYAFYFVRQFPLLTYYNGPYVDMGHIDGHSHAGFLLFVVSFSILFLFFGLAWHEVQRTGEGTLLPIVLGFGGVFGLTLTFVYPVTANDIFAYIDQSLIMVQYHQNPIAIPPAAFPHDPLMKLSAGWAGYGAPYGPLGLVIDALPTLVVRRNLLANLLLLKAMFSGLTVLSAYLVYQIANQIAPRAAVAGALFVAWNPLVLFEISANGHNDIAMVAFVLLALLWTVEGGWTVGPILLTVSGLVKYASIVLLPPLLVYGVARHPGRRAKARYVILTVASILCVVTVSYWPFWIGFDTFQRTLLENGFYLNSFSSTLHNLAPGVLSLDRASRLGRILFAPAYIGCLVLAARGRRELLEASLLIAFLTLALAINDIKYWYVALPIALAGCVPRTASWLAMTCMALGAEMAAALSVYVWVWIGVTWDTLRPINNVSYLIIFVVPVLVFVLCGGSAFWRPVPSRGFLSGERQL